MKYFRVIIIITITYLELVPSLIGQNSICPEGMVCSLTDWDWELDRNDLNYHRMWTARFERNDIQPFDAPWINPSGALLNKIADTQDFKKEDGWYLVARNFGEYDTGTDYPYFVLYNQIRGLLRVFVKLGNSNNTFTKIAIGLENVPDLGATTSILSASNSFMKSPDKYFENHSEGGGETIINYCGEVGVTGWVVSQFRPVFDPNLRSDVFTDTKITVNVLGVTNADLKINGQSTMSSVSFAGNKSQLNSSGNDENKLDKTEKVFEHITKIDKYRENINEYGKKIVEQTKPFHSLSSLKKFGAFLEEATSDSDVFGKILGGVSETGPYGTAAVGVIKFFSGVFGKENPSSNSPLPFVPTITNTNLTGFINWNVSLQSFNLRVPGAKSSGENITNQPFYDCPLGIFNLLETPKLSKHRWDGGDARWYCTYKALNPLKFAVNKSSGHKIKSVEVAFVGREEFPEALDPNSIYNGIPNWYSSYLQTLHKVDEVRERIQLVDFDPNKYIEYQTPFIDANRFEGFATNFMSILGKVFIRVKAIIEHPQLNSPLVIIRDYAVEIEELNERIEFHEANSNKFSSYELVYPYEKGTIYNPGNFLNNEIIPFGTYNEKGYLFENKELETQTANRGSVIIKPQLHKIERPTIFKATKSILFNPGFVSEKGSNFLGTINHQPNTKKATSRISFSFGECNELDKAYFKAKAMELSSFIEKKVTISDNLENFQMDRSFQNLSKLDFLIAPNPINEKTFVKFNLFEPNILTIKVLDSKGNTIRKIIDGQFLNVGKHEFSIHRNNLSAGIYFLQILSQSGVTTKKFIVSN